MQSYTAKSSAARAAKKAGIENPVFEKMDNGRWVYKVPAPAKAGSRVKKHFSETDSPCAVVWEICSQKWGEARKDIIQACVDAGVTLGTARTQYQAYKRALGA